LTRHQLDLTDFNSVRRLFADDKPQLILHCAALTKTPACAQNPPLARKLNVEVTDVLAGLAAEIPFVFFSTDLVFDGNKGNYLETDPVNPLNVYAETKVAAEQIVLRNPRHTVIRTSLNFGDSPTGDRSFNEELSLAWKGGKTLRLFTDEFRCPIAAVATAQAVWSLVAQNRPGLYHLAGRNSTPALSQPPCAITRDHPALPTPRSTAIDFKRCSHLRCLPFPNGSRNIPRSALE
jgi:dTDP-4-dehydrorhamnose reductase